jgi:GNAT superfamily N-acetyltransferase
MTTAATPFPYAVRITRPEDRDAILRLLAMTVGETAASRKTAAFWDWKHRDNPAGASYELCAYDPASGEIAGLRTLMWWSLRAPDGSPCRAVRAVDTATHPDHQRRGIFSALTRYAIEDLRGQGVPFVFNTPNRNSLPGYLKMGWRTVERWPLLMRPNRPLAFLGRLLLRALRRKPLSQEAEDVLISWSEFRQLDDGAVGSLIARHESSRRQVGYRTVRDLAYLDWRYGGHPEITYLVHPLVGPKGIEGFAVVRRVTSEEGFSPLVLTELFLERPSVAVARRLVSDLLRRSRADYVMAHFAPGTIEHRALRSLGFVRAPRRGYTFVARPLCEVTLDPTSKESWDLTLGELEIF